MTKIVVSFYQKGMISIIRMGNKSFTMPDHMKCLMENNKCSTVRVVTLYLTLRCWIRALTSQCVNTNILTVGIFATLAQHERELISGRTKATLQAKIAQGATLGKPENLTAEAQAKGVAGNARRAALNENNRRAASMAEMMHQAGKNYTHIANQLNRDGFRTSMGCQFQATQVMRLLQRKALA